MLILILGGARSGKSTRALRLAQQSEPLATGVRMIATAPHIEGDEDLTARIAAHRAERPVHWMTVEEPHDLAGALATAGADTVIIDCLTLWVNNLLWRGDTPEQVIRAATATAAAAAQRPGLTVVVSNEVGLGVHPASPEGREFRDLLGRVNTIWAAAADHSTLLVAGRALALTDPADTLGGLLTSATDAASDLI